MATRKALVKFDRLNSYVFLWSHIMSFPLPHLDLFVVGNSPSSSLRDPRPGDPTDYCFSTGHRATIFCHVPSLRPMTFGISTLQFPQCFCHFPEPRPADFQASITVSPPGTLFRHQRQGLTALIPYPTPLSVRRTFLNLTKKDGASCCPCTAFVFSGPPSPVAVYGLLSPSLPMRGNY